MAENQEGMAAQEWRRTAVGGRNGTGGSTMDWRNRREECGVGSGGGGGAIAVSAPTGGASGGAAAAAASVAEAMKNITLPHSPRKLSLRVTKLSWEELTT
ncbi:hypothetical protein ACS0TY_000270 [Phlomoides rotata]